MKKFFYGLLLAALVSVAGQGLRAEDEAVICLADGTCLTAEELAARQDAEKNDPAFVGEERKVDLATQPWLVESANLPANHPVLKREKVLWADSLMMTTLTDTVPTIELEKWLNAPPENYAGKFILIECWATWCPPCRRSLNYLNYIAEKYRDDLEVVAICEMDENAIRSMPGEHDIDHLKFDLAIDTGRRFANAIHVVGIPHAILIEPLYGGVVWEGMPTLPGHELSGEVLEKFFKIGQKLRADGRLPKESPITFTLSEATDEQRATRRHNDAVDVKDSVGEPSVTSAPALDERYRPAIYAELPDDMYGPDALCFNPDTGKLYLTCPNFLFGDDSDLPKVGSFLAEISPNGDVKKIFEFPVPEGDPEKIGAMGIDFGPDGNLYVCDNQYFFDSHFKSRLWRVCFEAGQPVDLQLVVSDFKVANAILWDGDQVFVTDTILDEEGKYGSGGVWRFTADEILKAGTDADHPAIFLNHDEKAFHDDRLIIVEDSENVRGNNCGADGICKGEYGVYYFGNYGDGGFYRFRFDANGKPEVEKIHKAGTYFRCVDGICYDPATKKVYISDSADNAIRAFEDRPWGEPIAFETIWENDDTNGADGSLDLPCECRVVQGKLIISNQDCPVGTTGKCQATDKPYSLSVINLE